MSEPRTLKPPPRSEHPQCTTDVRLSFDTSADYNIEVRGNRLVATFRNVYDEGETNMRWWCPECGQEWPCEPEPGTYWDNLEYE